MAAILLLEVLLEGIVPRQPLARGQQGRQRFDLLGMDNK